MFLTAIGGLLNSVVADCWKVPDSLVIENTGAIDDLIIRIGIIQR